MFPYELPKYFAPFGWSTTKRAKSITRNEWVGEGRKGEGEEDEEEDEGEREGEEGGDEKKSSQNGGVIYLEIVCLLATEIIV